MCCILIRRFFYFSYLLAFGVEIWAEDVAEWAELREVIESERERFDPPSDFVLSFSFLNIFHREIDFASYTTEEVSPLTNLIS